jgi:hypothetical protein
MILEDFTIKTTLAGQKYIVYILDEVTFWVPNDPGNKDYRELIEQFPELLEMLSE